MEWRDANGSQCNRGRRKSYQPAIASMRLMNSICVLMAQLFDDLADFLIFLVGTGLTDQSFKPAAIQFGPSLSMRG